MSRRPRDSQRSLVYAWERSVKDYHRDPEWKTMQEVAAWAEPIWRAERGRYGLAKEVSPAFVAAGWGQRRALSFASHKISLPMWARQRPVVLHEMAHQLTPADEAHGPRFVGVLIGLLARHAGYRAEELMESADAVGVKYYVKSIGAVPIHSLARRLETILPVSEMDAAIALDVSWKQVRGASIGLIRNHRARWLRGKLVALQCSVAQPEGAPRPGVLAPGNDKNIGWTAPAGA